MKPKVRVVIQCRLSSSRLPAKALLPVGGVPAVVLCALRARNSGHITVVATSADMSDDPLESVASAFDIPVVRGPLNDVLSRYAIATNDLADEDVVVRLTADNLFPDGDFIDELLAVQAAKNLSYVGTNTPFNGLPYGVSAEAFTVSALRRAGREATSAFDREHVTPAIIRMAGMHEFRPAHLIRDYSHLRATTDSFGDYRLISSVFSGIKGPESVSWKDLCERLFRHPLSPRFKIPARRKNGWNVGRIALGTAQIGLPRYGAANIHGRPLDDEFSSMIHLAISHGVNLIDCARAYGIAETRVGAALKDVSNDAYRIVTKLSPLDNLPSEATDFAVHHAVESSVLRSARELRVRKIDVLMVHRWEHRAAWRGAAWKRLLDLRDEGLIGAIGASVYGPEQAKEALGDPDVAHLQIPFNLLDWRWRAARVPEMAAARPDVFLFARSAYLQGILVSGVQFWPSMPGVDSGKWVRRIEEAARIHGRDGRKDLCLSYVLSQPWIDSVVVGMEKEYQLNENMQIVRAPPLSDDQMADLEDRLKGAPEELLDPSKWHG